MVEYTPGSPGPLLYIRMPSYDYQNKLGEFDSPVAIEVARVAKSDDLAEVDHFSHLCYWAPCTTMHSPGICKDEAGGYRTTGFGPGRLGQRKTSSGLIEHNYVPSGKNDWAQLGCRGWGGCPDVKPATILVTRGCIPLTKARYSWPQKFVR